MNQDKTLLAYRSPYIAAVLFITLVALALRCYHLSSQSLWTDEIYSVSTARAPLNQITELSIQTNNSLPTYALLLRAAIGQSRNHIEARARLISALAGAFTVPLFIWLNNLWRRSRRIALAAGVLLAVNPLHLWYSQETRAYALMLFFGVLALIFFELVIRRSHPPRVAVALWAGYFISAILATALHKTGLIFPILCAFWHGCQPRRCHPKAPILIHVAILLIGVTVLNPKSYPPPYERAGSPLEVLYTIFTYLGGYSLGPSLTQIQALGPMVAVQHHWLAFSIAAFLLILIAITQLRHHPALVTSRAANLFLIDLAMVAAYAAFSTFPYNIRYSLPALLGFVAICAGLAARHLDTRLTNPLLASIIALQLFADFQWFYNPIYRKEDSRAVATWLISHESTVNSWTIVPAFSAGAIKWYLSTLGHPEINSRLLDSSKNFTTSFPPTPDALVIGRPDHIENAAAIIASYQALVGNIAPPTEVSGLKIFSRIPAEKH